MDCLPFEIYEKIWSRLCREDLCSSALVNSQWRHMSYGMLYKRPNINTKEQLDMFSKISSFAQSFVRVLSFKNTHQHINDKILQGPLQHLNCLEKIDFGQCIQLSSSTINTIIQKNLRSVNSVSLSDCRISKDTLILIGEACQHKLISLDLSNTMIQPCSSIDSSNHLEDLIGIPSPKLRFLDLSYCTWVNNLTVKNIGYGLPALQHIVLQWCSHIKADAITEMVKQLMCLNTMDIRNIESIGTSEQVEDFVNEGLSLKKIMFTYKRSAVVHSMSYR
ncbi:hypothetical protein BY458DRAFT_577050 [Sporodiniella umbellata]|nr:hypothetical protein BY458DRAFT_577050 [Sporodiniella umbellata]